MSLRQTFDSLSPTAYRARVELLNENVDAWVARWQIIAAAQSTIDVDYFIFSQDLFGLALLGHLVEKSRQGVRVRMQLDAQGVMMSERPYGLDCMPYVANRGNVSVRLHRSLIRRLLEAIVWLEPTLATASDHDKVIVVDRRTSIVGGRNIDAKYFADPRDLDEAFLDVDVVLHGTGTGETLTDVFETTYDSDRVSRLDGTTLIDESVCARVLQRAYESMDDWLAGRPLAVETGAIVEGDERSWASELGNWPRLKGAATRARHNQPIEAETRILDSVARPGSAADAVTRSLIRLFDAASRRVLMETPYLVLTEEAAAVLAAAGERGVEMQMVTNSPKSTDNQMSQVYFRDQWPRLLAEVPGMKLFAGGSERTIHSKFVVFDDQLSLVGSYNLDPFSMLVSGEIVVAAWSRELARAVASRPRAMIAHGPPQVYEYGIERNEEGRPRLDSEGKPRIEFGPADHTEAEQGPLYGFRWLLFRAVPWVTGLPPFF